MNKTTDLLNATFWDNNYAMRVIDIISGNDITYNEVVIPYIKKAASHLLCTTSSVLDIGCGSGIITNILSESFSVTGIDISKKSIEYCKQSYPGIPFFCESIFHYNTKEKYDACFAVLVLHSIEDLSELYSTVNALLQPRGKFIIILPHPCFWPFEKIDCFNSYLAEEKYILPFRIKNNNNYSSNMIYFHRTLSTYIQNAEIKGFRIISFEELYEKDISKCDLIALIFEKQ